MEIAKFLQNFENMDHETLVAFAKVQCQKILKSEVVNHFAPTDEKKLATIVGIINVGVSVDGVITDKEKIFASEVLGLPVDLISSLAKQYDEKLLDSVDTIADNADLETKAAIIQLVCAVASCDETISVSETAFIKKLFA